MNCLRGKASPDRFTQFKLFANSGGFCQNPSCNENLYKSFEADEIHIAEIAHIISVNKGARKNNKLSPEEKGSFDNLILLCPNCHTTIDKAEDSFSVETILKWKDEHQQKLHVTFGIQKFQNRQQAKNALEPFFRENKLIFETYGPNTDDRFNPESSAPKIWIKKIREFIIPNNRKISELINTNYSLLNDDEKNEFEKFKLHLHDFEAKHLFLKEENGSQFPTKITDVYG
jgi:hypothetical protein